MKHIIRSNHPPDLPGLGVPKAEDLPLSEISVDRLIDNGLMCLHREMRNLMLASAKGKLDAASARDLRDTVKLLFELKDREKEMLKGKSDEELAELAQAYADDSK
jgi:hypothetical protein